MPFAGPPADSVKTRLPLFLSNYPFFFPPVLGGILRIPWSWSQTKVVNSDQVTSANLFDVLIRRKYVKEENIFFGEKKKTEKVKEEKILRRKISFWRKQFL